mgnify:CR=1 FL=1
MDDGGNSDANGLLSGDVADLRGVFGRFASDLLHSDYGHEIWDLYQRGLLQVDAVLTGRFEHKLGAVDVAGVMSEIDDARAEEAERRLRLVAGPLGARERRPRRRPAGPRVEPE